MNKYILFDVLDGVGGHEHGNTCVGGPDVSSPSCPLYRMDLQAAWHCSINLCLKSSVCPQCSMLTGISLSFSSCSGRHTQKPTYACMLIYLCFHHSCSCTHTHRSPSLSYLLPEALWTQEHLSAITISNQTFGCCHSKSSIYLSIAMRSTCSFHIRSPFYICFKGHWG